LSPELSLSLRVVQLLVGDSSDNTEDPEQCSVYNGELAGPASTSSVKGTTSVLSQTTGDRTPQLSSSIGHKQEGTRDETTSVGEPDCVRTACSDVSLWSSCYTPILEGFNTGSALPVRVATKYVGGRVPESRARARTLENVTVLQQNRFDMFGIPDGFEGSFECQHVTVTSCINRPLREDFVLQASTRLQNCSASDLLHGQGFDYSQDTPISRTPEISLEPFISSKQFSVPYQAASMSPVSSKNHKSSPASSSSTLSNTHFCVHCQKTFGRPSELT
jgi:hypothetical protein